MSWSGTSNEQAVQIFDTGLRTLANALPDQPAQHNMPPQCIAGRPRLADAAETQAVPAQGIVVTGMLW